MKVENARSRYSDGETRIKEEKRKTIHEKSNRVSVECFRFDLIQLRNVN